MNTHPTRPVYTHADVCAVTGVSSVTLQNWVNRGLVKIENPNPGKLVRRLYSALDVEYIFNVYRLVSEMGVPPSCACQYAAAMAIGYGRYLREADGLYDARLQRTQYIVAALGGPDEAPVVKVLDVADLAHLATDLAGEGRQLLLYPYGRQRLLVLNQLTEIDKKAGRNG